MRSEAVLVNVREETVLFKSRMDKRAVEVYMQLDVEKKAKFTMEYLKTRWVRECEPRPRQGGDPNASPEEEKHKHRGSFVEKEVYCLFWCTS